MQPEHVDDHPGAAIPTLCTVVGGQSGLHSAVSRGSTPDALDRRDGSTVAREHWQQALSSRRHQLISRHQRLTCLRWLRRGEEHLRS